MSKAKKITYWVATVWLALGLISTGIVQILQLEEETKLIIKLGYPPYIIPFLGVTKILALIAILIPGFTRLKEWAYAGIFFMMVGALYSHLVTSAPIGEIFPPVLMLALISTSWYFRPANRKFEVVTQ